MLIVVTLIAIPCGYIAHQAEIVQERKAIRGDLEGWMEIVQFEK